MPCSFCIYRGKIQLTIKELRLMMENKPSGQELILSKMLTFYGAVSSYVIREI